MSDQGHKVSLCFNMCFSVEGDVNELENHQKVIQLNGPVNGLSYTYIALAPKIGMFPCGVIVELLARDHRYEWVRSRSVD